METQTHQDLAASNHAGPDFFAPERFISQKKLGRTTPHAGKALHRKLRYPQGFTTTSSNGERCQVASQQVQRVSPHTTLNNAATLYLDWLKCQVDVNRRNSNTLTCRRYGLAFLDLTEPERRSGHTRWTLAHEEVGYLQRSAVIEWLSGLSNVVGVKGHRLESVEFTALRSLQALLKWCANRDACVPGLALGIEHEYQPTPQTSLSWSELDEIRDLLDLAEREAAGIQRTMVQLLIIVAADGARMHEIRCARVHQYDSHNGVMRWKTGKNRQPRVIVLSPDSKRIVQENIAGKSADDYIFINVATSRPPTHQAINKKLRLIASRGTMIREPHLMTCHRFRHSWATLAHEGHEDDGFEGCTVEDVADGLGHAATSTTKKHYLHNAVKPGARRVNRYMNAKRRRTVH